MSSHSTSVQVWIPRPVFQTYTYLVPCFARDFVFPGSRVQVSFGPQKLVGIVYRLSEQSLSQVDGHKLKEIDGVFEGFSFLSESNLHLIQWMSNYYLLGPGEVAGLFVPSYQPPAAKLYHFDSHRLEEILSSIPRRRKKFRQSLMRLSLCEQQIMSRDELLERSQMSSVMLRESLKDGMIEEKLSLPQLDSKYTHEPVIRWDLFPELTQSQSSALQAILNSGKDQYHYLRGVTGSGKTEVYMHLIARALQSGSSVIFLVPEISLTPQFIRLFESRFPDSVAVHHSRLSDREKYEYWKELREGRKKIVIGARSGLFSPMQNLGWIILDEEGESSYKQESSPYYDARTVAKELARLTGSQLLFGSATPSLDSFYQMKSNLIHRVEMKDRVNQMEMPKIEICDLKQDFNQASRSIFSRQLKNELQKTFESGSQAILFVHRRGHSSFVMCRSCSFILNCPHCEISLTYHECGTLHCHYCSYLRPMPEDCPSCKSKAIKYFGLGTQKAQTMFQKEFPGIPTARLDTDVTKKKGMMEKILQDFRDQKTKVLIGTQMIAKGLDFSNVTLVGVLNPDALVKMGDYSAHEKAFQLFVQIAGRSGRAHKAGKMILQTYLPDHPIYQRVQDYQLEEFLKEELDLRKHLHFPPYSRLIHIQSSSKDKFRARSNLEKFHEILLPLKQMESVIELSSVQESPIARLEGRYRFRCILKARYDESLWTKLREMRRDYRSLQSTRLKILVDAQNLL